RHRSIGDLAYPPGSLQSGHPELMPEAFTGSVGKISVESDFTTKGLRCAKYTQHHVSGGDRGFFSAPAITNLARESSAPAWSDAELCGCVYHTDTAAARTDCENIDRWCLDWHLQDLPLMRHRDGSLRKQADVVAGPSHVHGDGVSEAYLFHDVP